MTYDALVVCGFGGPEGPADVIPFLENVTRGRGVPPERLAEVAAQYELFGGVSPYNAQMRALVAALEASDLGLPVYWGNRNWAPYLGDTVRRMADDGVARAAAFAPSAFPGYSSCRQYLEDIAAAVGSLPIVIDKIPPFHRHPAFLAMWSDVVADAPEGRLLFSAHSIPSATAATNDYEAALREACAAVAGGREWELVFQSRSGPPQVPWLGPDVGDRIAELPAGSSVSVVPIGFTSDHMEVVYDLDTLAAGRAAEAGVTLRRMPTIGADRRFTAMVVDLVRALPGTPLCAPGHCPPPQRRG